MSAQMKMCTRGATQPEAGIQAFLQAAARHSVMGRVDRFRDLVSNLRMVTPDEVVNAPWAVTLLGVMDFEPGKVLIADLQPEVEKRIKGVVPYARALEMIRGHWLNYGVQLVMLRGFRPEVPTASLHSVPLKPVSDHLGFLPSTVDLS